MSDGVCRIKVRARGPLAVEGPFELVDAAGTPIDTRGAVRVLLCRCGASARPPFCDSSHFRTAFEAPAEPPATPDHDPGA